MTLIGLTGGIASGKSMIGARLAELGAFRIDADQLARDAVAPGSPGLDQIVERFGAGVLLADGSLDRTALGAIVFDDADALKDLNAIVHPEVRRVSDAHISRARDKDRDAVIVYEIPLLVEAERGGAWDLIVVADAPADQRVARMVRLRGMQEEDAWRRVASQATDAQRRAVADVVIDTSGTEEETLAQVHALWQRVSQRP